MGTSWSTGNSVFHLSGTRCIPGWMEKSLFIQKQSREPGDQKFEVQNGRQKSSRSKYIIRTKNLNFRINRQGLGRIRIGKQRGVLYNFTINWLTQNRHRIMINVLTGDRQKDWSIYTYIRILNLLRGSWDMRRD